MNRNLFASLWHQIEPWYLGYALQAVVVFGTGGLLIPILIANQGGDAALAGTVMAMFYGGQLLSPLMGALTDRTGWYRLFYLTGYVLLAIGLGLFPTTDLVWFWILLALLQGIGAGTSNTVVSMFVVEFHPKQEWDTRIGVIQTFYGVGQCLGMVLVAYLEQSPALGLYLSAALMVPAFALGSVGLPSPGVRVKPEQPTFTRRKHKQRPLATSMLGHYEVGLGQVLRRMRKEWLSPFGMLILSWFFVMLATWLVGVLYPLLMKQALGVSYRLSSIYYGVGAFIGIFAYAPSGALGKRIGDGWVVMIGFVATLIAVVGMAILAYVDTGINSYLLPPIYMLIPIAWSPLIVGGNAWTAQLAPMEEGEALGIFNAALGISSVLAAFGGGIIAHQFGFKMVLVVAAGISVISVVLLMPLMGKTKSSGA